MAIEPRRIHADQKTALSDVLSEATKSPVLVEKDGALYRVSPEPETVWAGYDPKAVQRALQKSAGAFAGIDAEQLKADILAGREQDSHGRPV